MVRYRVIWAGHCAPADEIAAAEAVTPLLTPFKSLRPGIRPARRLRWPETLEEVVGATISDYRRLPTRQEVW